MKLLTYSIERWAKDIALEFCASAGNDGDYPPTSAGLRYYCADLAPITREKPEMVELAIAFALDTLSMED